MNSNPIPKSSTLRTLLGALEGLVLGLLGGFASAYLLVLSKGADGGGSHSVGEPLAYLFFVPWGALVGLVVGLAGCSLWRQPWLPVALVLTGWTLLPARWGIGFVVAAMVGIPLLKNKRPEPLTNFDTSTASVGTDKLSQPDQHPHD